MNANQLNGMLRFTGGRPMLILRDHTKGRIKVFLCGVWSFTVIPRGAHSATVSEGGYDCDAMLLGCEDADQYAEERTTWGGVAHALSTFQQTGEVPCMDDEGFEIDLDSL